jgi:hypothetical protein
VPTAPPAQPAGAGTQAQNAAAANPNKLVVPANFHSRWVSQSSDVTLDSGEVATLTVRFRNTGSASWVKGAPGQQVNLAVVGDGAKLGSGWPNADRAAVQTEDVVAPGEVATFTFDVRAPAGAASYRIDVRPVVEGTTWLEDDGVFITLTSRGLAQPAQLSVFGSMLERASSMTLELGLLFLLALVFLIARTLARSRRTHVAA